MTAEPRAILAPNASPMTMDGTVTYVVGRHRAVVIDPASAVTSHLDAIAAALPQYASVRILLTHSHPDHGGGARELARRLDARVYSIGTGTIRDGSVIPTDDGDLVALATPGHAPDHAAFHWPAARAAFCGDLMMGGLETALVAAPEGDLGQYLDSLQRLRALGLDVIYPAHGPSFTAPAEAIDRCVEHRASRERQVLDAIAGGARDVRQITETVYGHFLDPALRTYAEGAIQAYVAHLVATDRFPEAPE